VSISWIQNLCRVDIATALYLLAVAGLVLLFGGDLDGRGFYLGLHGVLAGLILLFPYLRRRNPPQPVPFLLDWYPAFVFPLLYKQVEFLAAAFGNWSMTGVIQRWEVQLFNGHPSLWLSERFPSVLLSEYLHFCYISYVVLLPAIGGYWYFAKRRPAFRELVFLLSVTYYSSYLFYILFPVDSPYYLFSPPGGAAGGNFFYNLVHFVSDRAGARGGAFPSTHVSASTVILLTVLRHQRKLGYFLLPIVIGIYFATIYGRFHYALDVVAGLALGGLVVIVFWHADARERSA